MSRFWFLLLAAAALYGLAAGRPARPADRLIGYTEAAKADLVESLPGWGDLDDVNIFAGYVDATPNRHLYYVYVESASDPSSDPLALWLNGGPGCSSIGGGFLSELGPFFPADEGSKLVRNPLAWNRKSNILFLDSPAYVGFSYSEDPSDRVVGDARTALDARSFLLGWFERFPQLKGRDFWITGESYAGHYLPNLASAIVLNSTAPFEDPVAGSAPPSAPPSEPLIPGFKGILVGNPWTDPELDNRGAVDFWFSHGIISRTTRDGIVDTCDFTRIGPLAAKAATGRSVRDPLAALAAQAPAAAADSECDWYVQTAQSNFEHINIYDIYADVCLDRKAARAAAVGDGAAAAADMRRLRKLLKDADEASGYNPCIDDEVSLYLNRKEVQEALHVRPQAGPRGSSSLPAFWTDCTHEISYSWTDVLTSALPVYHALLKAPQPLRLVIYSGDVDAIVPVTGTRAWVHSLDLPVSEEWRPWFGDDGQVGGWTVGHGENVTFVSVRGAGHMVPYTQPGRGRHLFERVIEGRDV